MSPLPPPLSANSLFHFTNSIENLLNILREEFRPRFCLENFSGVFPSISGRPVEWAVPMFAFVIYRYPKPFHLEIYGDYGIGLTKEWGKKNGIAPILYAYPGSILSSKLLEMMEGAKFEVQLTAHGGGQTFDDLFDLMCFIKPYEGDLWRAGSTVSGLRFYNEREWRFVPRLEHGHQYRYGLKKESFLDDTQRQVANDRIFSAARISFEPNDIKYLVVRREDEIVPLIGQLESIKGRYSYEAVRLLFSRIISAEQIREDF